MIVSVKCKECGAIAKVQVAKTSDIESLICPDCGKQTLARDYSSVGAGRIIASNMMAISQSTLKG